MSLGKIPCSCGGENPSCFHCDGTGFNSDGPMRPYRALRHFGQLPPKRIEGCAPRPTPEIEAAAQALFEAARSRSWRWLPERQKDRWRQLARDAQRTPPPERRPQYGLQPSKCLVCHRRGCMLRAHQKAAAAEQATLNKPANAKSGDARQRVEPASAGAPGTPVDPVSPPEAAAKRPASQTPGRSVRPDGASGTDDGGDASYGWGGAFRDHGQFGSHPSFDGMDDESSP